ncbi:MAG TPA: hypothetical protein DG754_08975 [Bacteroidales bacterium]|jgi:hypothetical protein|nr:hypothetical protein [Bacteroidales bacterium]
MDINRNNYEFFLIDYIEGNLTTEQLKTVEAFLLLNLDIKNEIEGLSDHVLMPEDHTYTSKSNLKKPGFFAVGIESEFDYLCIANLENDLKEEEEIKLKSIVNNNKSKAKDYNNFSNTILLPNKNICYKQKSRLKRFTLLGYTRKQIISFSSAAALVLLLITIFNNNTNLPETPQDDPFVQDIEKPLVESVTIFKDETEKGETLDSGDPKRVQNIGVTLVTMEPKEELTTRIVEAIVPKRKEQELTLAYLKPKTAHIIIVENDLHKPSHLLYANMPVKELMGGVNPEQQGTNRVFGLFELAQLGVNRLAKATGRSINLEIEKDETGKIKRIEFSSQLFALSAPVNREK